MAAPFANPSDVAARWRPLTPAEQDQASTLLGDASLMLRAIAPDVDARIMAGTLDQDVPVLIVCAMVKRAMIAGQDAAGVTSQQQSAGPFSQSFSYANPTADLYVTKAERKLLGVGQQAAFTVPMTSRPGVVHRPWCALAFGATYCSCGADIAGEPIFEAG